MIGKPKRPYVICSNTYLPQLSAARLTKAQQAYCDLLHPVNGHESDLLPRRATKGLYIVQKLKSGLKQQREQDLGILTVALCCAVEFCPRYWLATGPALAMLPLRLWGAIPRYTVLCCAPPGESDVWLWRGCECTADPIPSAWPGLCAPCRTPLSCSPHPHLVLPRRLP